MKNPFLSMILAAAVLAATPAWVSAQAASTTSTQGVPSQMVLNNSTRIIATLDKRRAEFSKNSGALRQFVASEFDAVFDRDYAARLVLGRHGRGAADADVKLFADALADSLTQRYGSSLLAFDAGIKVRVKSETSLRGGAIVKVASEYIRPAGAPVPIDYLMHKVGTQWQVFDVMVEGVSFVQTFRSQFDPELARKPIKQVAAELRGGLIQSK